MEPCVDVEALSASVGGVTSIEQTARLRFKRLITAASLTAPHHRPAGSSPTCTVASA
ncbi:hypothetical protein ABZ172_17245 [Streptomyces sp. NPDC006296]|uniref:hypothetical protein n=1 Tax=Streptomyces sp. NPDC006296 TaxID=3156746 RepID=UPI0033B5F0BD